MLHLILTQIFHICEKHIFFCDKDGDHDRISGEFRRAGHNSCNPNFGRHNKNFFIQVIFHNLRGYASSHSNTDLSHM